MDHLPTNILTKLFERFHWLQTLKEMECTKVFFIGKFLMNQLKLGVDKDRNFLAKVQSAAVRIFAY